MATKGKTGGRYTCPHCGDGFKTKQGRGSHIFRTHPDKFVPSAYTVANRKARIKRASKPRKMGNRHPERVLPDKVFDGKDKTRSALQSLAMLHLQGHLPRNAHAICLPGLRPGHERKLMSGFKHVTMVENNGKVLKAAKDTRIVRGDFIDVLIEEGANKPFSLVDFDLCGRPTYREGSILVKAVSAGLVTPRSCIRLTYCTRSSKGPVRSDLDQLDEDFREVAKVVSYETIPYRNKKGTSMEVRQWILDAM